MTRLEAARESGGKICTRCGESNDDFRWKRCSWCREKTRLRQNKADALFRERMARETLAGNDDDGYNRFGVYDRYGRSLA